MSRSLYENHWGSPTLTLLNVLGVLNVLNVLNVLYVLYVLYVLNVLHVLHVLHGRIVGLLGLVFFNFSLISHFPFINVCFNIQYHWLYFYFLCIL